MAVVVTWNPRSWTFDEGQYEMMVSRTAAGSTVPEDWSVGRRVRGIDVGDRVFLLRQGDDRRGVVASGRVAPGTEEGSPIFLRHHHDGSERLAPYVNVDWDRVVDIDDRLSVDVLLDEHDGFGWNTVYESGRPIVDDALASLEALWERWTGRVPASAQVTGVAVAAGERHGVRTYWSRGTQDGDRERIEAELCARYLAFLDADGVAPIRHRITTPDGSVLWTDIYDPRREELVEAKRDAGRDAVRLAIGQLLDYRRYLRSTVDPDLAVLLPVEPSQDLLALLAELSITAIWPAEDGTFHRA